MLVRTLTLRACPGRLSESFHRLRSAQGYALLCIPPDFEVDVLAGKQPSVVIYYNALFYSARLYFTQDFSSVIAEINANTYRIIDYAMSKTLPSLPDVRLFYGNLLDASGSYIYY